MSVASKDIVVLTDEVRKCIEDGGAIRMPVPTTLLRYRSNDGTLSDDFKNPRRLKGFGPDDMQELEESIANDGLFKNLLVRQATDLKTGQKVFEIVQGERRTRAITALMERNAGVYDQSTGNRVASARRVYETVPCLIQGACDDARATRLSFLENETHVPLSDADVIDMCLALEAQGFSRKVIADMLGKCQAWLCHILGFRERLSPENYQRLRDGEISRSVAVGLMNYPAEIQTPIVEAAREIAEERHEEVRAKVHKEVEVASDSVNQALKDKLEVNRRARHDESVDDRAQQLAEQKVASAEKKLASAEKKLARTREKEATLAEVVPAPSQSDLAEAAYKVTGAAHGNRNLNAAQIREHYTERTKMFLDLGSGDALDIETGRNFLRHDLMLINVISQAIGTGERDMCKILREFYTRRGIWTGPAPVITGNEEEIDDDDEADVEEELDIDLEDDDDCGRSKVSATASKMFGDIDVADFLEDDEDDDD
jgi:hypothetical protein